MFPLQIHTVLFLCSNSENHLSVSCRLSVIILTVPVLIFSESSHNIQSYSISILLFFSQKLLMTNQVPVCIIRGVQISVKKDLCHSRISCLVGETVIQWNCNTIISLKEIWLQLFYFLKWNICYTFFQDYYLRAIIDNCLFLLAVIAMLWKYIMLELHMCWSSAQWILVAQGSEAKDTSENPDTWMYSKLHGYFRIYLSLCVLICPHRKHMFTF